VQSQEHWIGYAPKYTKHQMLDCGHTASAVDGQRLILSAGSVVASQDLAKVRVFGDFAGAEQELQLAPDIQLYLAALD